MDQQRIRASDIDRQQVIDALQAHTAAGRLTLDEFDQRATAAWSAVTQADLAALTHDLPTLPVPRRRRTAKPAILLAAAAAAAIAVGLGAPVAAWAHHAQIPARMPAMMSSTTTGACR